MPAGAYAGVSDPLTITPDSSFNHGQPVTISFPPPPGGSGVGGVVTAVKRQTDGKVLVAGYNDQLVSGVQVAEFDVERFNPDGTLDTGFGTGGVARVSPTPGAENFPSSLAVQSNGKIVVAGTSGFGPNSRVALARFTGGGQLDSGFATGGSFVGSSLDAVGAMTLDANDKILTIGKFGNVNRFTAGGAVDTSFNPSGASPGSPGTVITGLDQGTGIAVQPSDGKVVYSGYSAFSPMGMTRHHAYAGRLNADGSGDTGFGATGSGLADTTPGGFNETTFDDFANALALQADGKILLAGCSNTNSLLVRLNTTGLLDPTFGNHAGRRTDPPPSGFGGTCLNSIVYDPYPGSETAGTNSVNPMMSGTPTAGDTQSFAPDGTPGAQQQIGAGAPASGTAIAGDGSFSSTQGKSTSDTVGATSSGAATLTQNKVDEHGSTPPPKTCPPPGSMFHKCADIDLGLLDSVSLIEQIGVVQYDLPPDSFSTGDPLKLEWSAVNFGPSPAACESVITVSGVQGAVTKFCGGGDIPVNNGLNDSLDFAAPNAPVTGERVAVTVTLKTTDALDVEFGQPTFDSTMTFTLLVYGPLSQTSAIMEVSPNGATGTLANTGHHTQDRAGTAKARKKSPPIKRVQIAILDATSGSHCRWVATVGVKFTPPRASNSCDAPVWLTAHGTQHWSLRLKRRLPRGKYVFLVRATDTHGDMSGGFSLAKHTEATLTVH